MTTTPLRTSLDPLAAAWLAGGLPRAVDALLVSRLESRRIQVVDGSVADRGLDRQDRFDAVLLDALGARRSKRVDTVWWRLVRDRRLESLRFHLRSDDLLAARTGLGLPDRDDRPARTAAGRHLLRELRSAPPRGAAWEVALHGRGALTDLSLRAALEGQSRPAAERPMPRWSRRRTRDPARDLGTAAGGGAAYTGTFGGGWSGGGWDGGCGGDGGGGGGC